MRRPGARTARAHGALQGQRGHRERADPQGRLRRRARPDLRPASGRPVSWNRSWRCSSLGPSWFNKAIAREDFMTRPSARALLLGTASAVIAFAAFGTADNAAAKVTRIVIEKKTSPAFDGASYGSIGQYETLVGKAYGELDPNDRRNAIITDIRLAPKNARGMVEYMTTFQIVKPVDMSKASRFMWQDVPNRTG